jgi:Zn-finger nucleic acid-binding protein
MEAGTVNCPMCGAATSTDAPQCRYCEAKLATVACPSCFAMMFIGSKHCPRCGASAERLDEVVSAGKTCPRCKTDIEVATIGNEKVLECGRCGGLWLNTRSFERVCANTEQHSALLGSASLSHVERGVVQEKVTYVPCPECSQLMNRANFAHCSGVIIDICKQHGVWFDRDELSRIVEFIRAGGLNTSRTKERHALDEERRKLQQEQLSLDAKHSSLIDFSDSERVSGISSTRALLKFLLG